MRDGFEPERIVEVLERHAVACIVVGGYAAQLHGATRLTTDLDLVADFDRENLRRLAAAMRELNARARVEGSVDPATIEASKSLVHEDFLAGIEISTWDTDAGPLDRRRIPRPSWPRRPRCLARRHRGVEGVVEASEGSRGAG
jgi:hypothetical protein